MAHRDHTDKRVWKRCTGCGLKIRMMGGRQSLAFFIQREPTQRRGFRCANCGQVTCFACSTDGRHCACRSNAWVALPYLDPKPTYPSNELKMRS